MVPSSGVVVVSRQAALQGRLRSSAVLAVAFVVLGGGIVLATVWNTPASARIVVPDESMPDDVVPVLGRLRIAFEDGDHEALVALLHPDGVRVGLGPESERASHMNPAQAHYYFKNRFQLQRTTRFAINRQQLAGPDRLHAAALWRWERTDTGREGSQRLLLTLVRVGGQWRVSEITAVRGH